MSLLWSWCKGEGVDPSHAVVVSDVPDDTEVGEIENTLQNIKTLGRVRVRGRLFDPHTQRLVVLCECKEVVSAEALPSEVYPASGDSPWILRGSDDEVTTVVFETKGTNHTPPQLPPRHPRGNTQPETPSPDVPASIPVDTFFKVVENLIENTTRPYEGTAFRRLRVFSGVLPTPAGEESLDTWLDQARLMIDESELPRREKRKRIIECLRGPAFDIAQAVRSNDPDATPDDYLTALEKAFGSTESGEDVYIAFRSMQQHAGEKLSDFLRRIECSLTKVVQKGGLHTSQRDRARVEQLLRGAVESDLMLVQLRLRERKHHPPTFLTLLHEIREEEERQLARGRATAGTLQVHSQCT
ncbi:paraneoplastic antigen Ma1 homolog [Sardina pilchardus]|uniref:paraneoplastic antigen Ma1 homolog n=1 Tax=Sardina pilchardus TaxID=27697 RepID=UPI002E13B453